MNKMDELIYCRSRYFRVVATGLTFLINITLSIAGCADTTVGVENKYIIPNSSFTALSHYDDRFVPSNGRLGGVNGWAPANSDRDNPNAYLQIDLGLPYIICAVATQGNSASHVTEWVTQYKISLSMDNTNWTPYQENGALKLFAGNTDGSTIKKHILTQPLARYIRFIPTTYNNYKVIRVGIYGYLKACENLPLGMESGAIPDGNITASSAQHPAKNARLHYTSGSSWCSSTSDSNPYLQIDLGSSHLICAVATQGNSQTDQWMKTYQITTSNDGTTWTTYQENNTDRIFYGNYNRSTVIRRVLYHGVVTRYLRIVPKTYQTITPCLRTEIYGYPFQTSCSSHSVGIPSTSLVPDHRFTATSYSSAAGGYEPYKGRLGLNKAWAPLNRDDTSDYLQIDLGAVFHICAVATQGAGDGKSEWAKKYKVLHSTNNVQWTIYSTNSVEKEFMGNTDRTTVVTNAINNPFRARFVRVRPTDYNGWKMLRVDFKGLPLGCTSSLGLENSQIPDSQITSSSFWTDSNGIEHLAIKGRLYGSLSWCSGTNGNTEYIQVDLGQVKTVTGIATQGNPSFDAWLTSYKVEYSFDNTHWNEYREGQVVKTLDGNTNRNDVRVNWLRQPIAASYVRIYPQTYHAGQCLRFDLYGCDIFVAPKVLLDTADFILPSIKGSSRTLTCSVLGEPPPDIQWFNNGTKINGATRSTLQVQFISAEDVVSKYNCTRQDANTRIVVCNTFLACRATYPSYVPGGGMDEASVKGTVNLNVPEPPSFSGTVNQRSITLRWIALTPTDDVGQITWYAIKFQNQSSTRVFYVRLPSPLSGTLSYLKPYTNYSVAMKAISIVGHGLWSSGQTIRTLIAKPTGVPVVTSLVASSSQSIQVNWKFTEHDRLYGPLAGFTIKYTPRGGTSETARVNGDVRTTTLMSLEKYTVYDVTILVRNTQYDGPESVASSRRTMEDAPSCAPTLLTANALSSTSIAITWRPIPLNSKCLNGVLTRYKVFYRKASGGPTSSPTYVYKSRSSAEVTGLDKYTRYEFEVLARTVSDGPRSTAVQATTMQDAPSQPVNLQRFLLRPGHSNRVPRFQITWEKPREENGIITRYVIYYSITGTGVSISKTVNITDTNNLTYTMTVPGETRVSVHMKASTIKDGPHTTSQFSNIPAFPPAIAPRNTRSTKINETTFRIAWQPLPRDQSNGVVTKYEITWQMMRTGNRRRRSLGLSVTASTQDTEYAIYKLKLCAHYDVYVKGFTKAGPGPNSTLTILTSQPGEPLNVRPAGKGKRNIELKWEKPLAVSKEIESYKIVMKGFKPYWKSWANVSKDFKQSGEQTNKNFQGLQPGTSYEFWVISITECGESNKSLSTFVNTEIDAPVQPKGKPVKLEDNLNVSLWPVKPENGPISSYHVIVIKGEDTEVDTLPDDIQNYKDSKETDQDFYIAAEIKVNHFLSIPEQFPVGDGKVYEGYENVPLNKGQTYTIAERATTFDNKKIFMGKAAKIATIHLKAGKEGAEPVSKPVTGPAIGGALGFLILLAFVLLGLFLYRRRRLRSKEENHESDVALDDFKDNEQQERESVGAIDGQEEPGKYVNVVVPAPAANEEIYDQTTDNTAKPIPVRQFAEYVKSTKATDYARLKEEFKHLPNAQLFSISLAKIPENKKKNRYGNIVTYNHSRVVIERTGDENSDYINASYIEGFDGTPKVYIASQGPIPKTFSDFWQMIWEQNTCTIVMLTNLVEGGKTKCHEYWPETKETYRVITVNHHKTEVFPDYIIRTFFLTKANSDEKRNVLHFQFTVWPDKGVPHYATAVLALRRKVKARNPQNAGPVVVHCSAGVGRTGAYIVIDAMLDRAKKLRNVEICNYVAKIRRARPYMVQTDEQYVFIHLAVLEVLTCGNTEIQAYNLQNVMNKLSTINPQKQISGFAVEFERLNVVTADYAEEECDVGQSVQNASKNRYSDVVALNSCRALLTKEDATEQDSDYINASFNHAYRERNAFIMTQAPLQNTIEDFWIMIVNYDIRTIAMLNTLEEENEQFPQYWPQTGAETYGNVTVELLSTQDIGELVSRRLQVTYKSSTVRVQHVQHLKWPDKCIPMNSQTVLDLLNEVEQSQRQSSNAAPIVVQCSNGVGRSGTFCAIFSILERMKQEQVIDVFQVVKCIRSNRPGAVDSLTQYIFCYQIIQKYLDSFSDYANFTNT